MWTNPAFANGERSFISCWMLKTGVIQHYTWVDHLPTTDYVGENRSQDLPVHMLEDVGVSAVDHMDREKGESMPGRQDEDHMVRSKRARSERGEDDHMP